jgi:hypothetical protein
MARPSSLTTESTHEPLLRPTRNTPLKLHIHREGLNDRSVKAESQKTVLYYIRSPYTLSSTSPLKAYRGRPDQASHIADMKPADLSYTLEFPGPGPKVMIEPPSGGIFCTKSKFVVNGKEFAWKSDKELREVGSDVVVAKFERTMFSISEKGVMTIYGDLIERVDIVVLTGIAMQYRWEKTRDNR